MKGMKGAVGRRKLAVVSSALGFLLLSIACFIYLRYASDPSNMHVAERIRHARTVGLLWRFTFLGSILLFFVSLFGLGPGRWVALAVSAAAFIFALMTLGAMCGPFGC